VLHRYRPDDMLELLDPALPIFVLVDPLLGDPIPVAVGSGDPTPERALAWQRDVARVALPSSIVLPARLHPYLVRLNGPDDAWIADTLDIARKEASAAQRDGLAGSGRGAFRIGGWLQSNRAPDALAAALADAMRLRRFADASYLRLADRRTLDWLLLIIGEDRVAGALAFVERWVWLDAVCSLNVMTSSKGTSADAVEFSLAEWADFSLAREVHPCLARCLGHQSSPGVPDALPGVLGNTATEALAQVRAAVKRAHRERAARPELLAGDDDVIAWAAMSLLHPGFDQHAAFEQALAACAADGTGTFNALCPALCDELLPTTKTAP
jgi:hypothetical protein